MSDVYIDKNVKNVAEFNKFKKLALHSSYYV